MASELSDVNLEKIEFLKRLFSSDYAVIFLVRVRDLECVMKVHRGRGPRQYYEREGELDIHIHETKAYARLKERGICDRGIVPQYLGSISKFDPSKCQPHLSMFQEDEYLPSALFLEYIPGLEMISLTNYTPQRVENLVSGMREIHKALVCHNDPQARNMMIVKDSPDRVVWLDFDRARTFDEDHITEQEEEEYLRAEDRILEEFRVGMEADYQNGEINKTFLFFYA
ncbi:hypothetical protein N7462_002234 [Penicillium macrosclerotiorum]|uniref:uncharacterized protein n=1 Tax=Penicillium macrosclerotiorum TaxID=303699 RepID=UPI0025477355|nr:uncharacterized protein N7462_002234 [Penicillium macrosclerotiorum]KAJ5692811.1 hypothetical protein N7462_002234 [Penicillium macrosclerotiorum]